MNTITFTQKKSNFNNLINELSPKEDDQDKNL